MRKLTSLERRLLLALGTAAILLLNLVVIRWISAQVRESRAAIETVNRETAEYQLLASERPYWEARQAWLESNQPVSHSGPATDSAFAEKMQSEMRKFNLTIETQQLGQSENLGDWIATPLDLTVRGNLESLVRWLQSTQAPGKFIAVRSFNLRQSEDGTSMVLRIRLQQLFLKPQSSGDGA
jgi:hypothetical protein